eukprot:m.140991 g.140991  ORF g.140991 m.140991 type:complete len:298 (+) comp52585_c0_seq1:249-1142(+)
MGEVDELFDVRTLLQLGAYSQAVTDAQKLKVGSNEELKLQRDCLVYRAYLAQGKYSVIKSEIKSDVAALQAIKQAALYFQSPSNRAGVLAGFKKLLDDGVSMKTPTVALVAAAVFSHDNNVDDALRSLKQSDGHLEAMAGVVQLYLKLDRVDLAKKEVKRMQEKDDDATITQLANAWLNLTVGGEKIQDAAYTFQELSDKYGQTPLLLNAHAAAHTLRGKYDEAERLLNLALEKNPNDADSLLNLASLAVLTAKGTELSDRYINQLRDAHPEHPFLRNLASKQEEFERAAVQYSSSK